MLKGDEKINNAYRQANEKGHIFIIPAAAYYEIRRGLIAVNATAQIAAFYKLCNSFDVEEMTIDSWEKAARIWATLRERGTPIGKGDGDILIAAQCIVNGYTVITDNVSDFSRIDGIEIINWKD